MGRIIMPVLLTIAFLIWCIYHLLIKKDFQSQKNNFYLGLFFMVIWAIIYALFFS